MPFNCRLQQHCGNELPVRSQLSYKEYLARWPAACSFKHGRFLEPLSCPGQHRKLQLERETDQ